MTQFLLSLLIILISVGLFGDWYGRRKARQLRKARCRTDGRP